MLNELSWQLGRGVMKCFLSYVVSRKYRSSRNGPFRSWGVALDVLLDVFRGVLLVSNKITKV